MERLLSSPQTGPNLHKHIAWADAYIVTYSICDLDSFSYAVHLLETISLLRGAIKPPTLLLGNKKDLEHSRQVRGWQTGDLTLILSSSRSDSLSLSLSLSLTLLLVSFARLQVPLEDGQETSLQYECQFNEVSAAESYVSISLVFQTLIKQALAAALRSGVCFRRRKTSPSATVSRVIGLVFGQRVAKKRPSLSI